MIGEFVRGCSYIDSGVYVKCLCKGADNLRNISLTFDDGPDEVMTPKILDILKEHDIKATFFLIGKKAKKFPELVARIVEEGHIIGGHTWKHTYFFPLKSTRKVHKEFCKCENILHEITGKRVTLFRPPFGITNPNIAKAIKDKEYIPIGWSVRSYDTVEKSDRKEVLERISTNLHNGAIILMHDRCKKADELLNMVIADIKSKEYNIVPLDEMLDIAPYKDNN